MLSVDILTVKERKQWIDALRAIAILLVMYGHCVKGLNLFFVFTSPIKMPLFFCLSGYLFNIRGGSQKQFWKNLLLKLVVPWFCLAFIPVFPKVFSSLKWGCSFLYEVVSGQRYWFMPCLIVAEVIHFYIRKVSSRISTLGILSVLSFAAGILMHKVGWLNFAMINRALTVQLFFFLGILFKTNERWFKERKVKEIVAVVFLYFIIEIISILLFPNQSLDVHHNYYYNFPICLSLIIIGVLLLFTVFSKLNVGSRLLSFIGQNTLVFYMWHGYAYRLHDFFMKRIGVSTIPIWFDGIIKVIVACLVCGVFAMIINHFFPVIVGKKRVL